jgi:hypothetical protein
MKFIIILLLLILLGYLWISKGNQINNTCIYDDDDDDSNENFQEQFNGNKNNDIDLQGLVVNNDNANNQHEILMKKMKSKNSNVSKEYRQMNYALGNRNQNNANIEFNDLNINDSNYEKANLLEKKRNENDGFDSSELLPKDTHDDWFDVPPEPISVKNNKLINVTRTISTNTIGTSNKNASHDIRGEEQVVKFHTGPWNQSSIEPLAQYNLKKK